jgi:hypothetical protein
MTDWQAWHTEYGDPDSALNQRLLVIQSVITDWLDGRSAPADILSLCAGDGRDVLDVLMGRPDASRVAVTLVELDPGLAQLAHDRAHLAGLTGVEIRCADAGSTTTFADRLPVDLLILAGVFGNISNRDIERTVAALPAMLRLGGTVIWTRSRRDPDLTPTIRAWLRRAGFEEQLFAAAEGAQWSVGVHVLARPTADALPASLFAFEN